MYRPEKGLVEASGGPVDRVAWCAGGGRL